jgi:hypothetical protein
VGPSAEGITLTSLPSIVAITEFVVPKSIPIGLFFAIFAYLLFDKIFETKI